MVIKSVCMFLISVVFVSCASVSRQSPPELIGFTERGQASFYADSYQFRQTASGDRFNQLSRTAAHKELPFGAQVRVTNLANGESVVVTINDRGPFVEGRIIDLTRSAFASIADMSTGVIDVEIEVIE